MIWNLNSQKAGYSDEKPGFIHDTLLFYRIRVGFTFIPYKQMAFLFRAC